MLIQETDNLCVISVSEHFACTSCLTTTYLERSARGCKTHVIEINSISILSQGRL